MLLMLLILSSNIIIIINQASLNLSSHNCLTRTCTPPHRVPLKLSWAGRAKEISVHWFQFESDPDRNSNVYEVGQKAVNDNFPGEFGSERLVQEVVDRLLAVTATQENLEQVTGLHPPTVNKVQSSSTPTTPTKEEARGTIKTRLYKIKHLVVALAPHTMFSSCVSTTHNV